ncbi:hypothetical protein HDU82_003321 [Entophlyctis luteolus]|nr:hypothetical protein HDU82_003321 [Entophlyctis luteolus]
MKAQFACVLLGAPGSGKTTACHGLQQFFQLTKRDCAVVNIDPANDGPPCVRRFVVDPHLSLILFYLWRPSCILSHRYSCDVDIAELITLEDVMREFEFGPNGGLIYCMEYLEKNMDWLLDRLKAVEDASKYISSLLLSLKTMLHLSQPHINVLSKIDLIQTYGRLTFNLDFYTEVQDLSYLLEGLKNDVEVPPRFAKLNAAVCELVEEFGIVSYTTLCIEDRRSIKSLVDLMDRANGWFGKDEEEGSMLWAVAGSNYLKYFEEIQDVQERFIGPHDIADDEAVFEPSSES